MENKFNKPKLTPELAHHNIKNWCAYQERSQHETRQKLYEYGLYSDDVEQLIVKLIEENFLNEERFAFAFVSGKFNIKHWGRIKIKIELGKHKVSDYLVKKALQSIDETNYIKTLTKLIEKRIKLTSEKNKQKLTYKLMQYVLSRGFESDISSELINNYLTYSYKNK